MRRAFFEKKIAKMTIILLFMLAMIFSSWAETNAETKIPFSAKINAASGANIRQKASTSSAVKISCENNTNIRINYELFKKNSSTKSTDIWYNVSVSGKKGFARKDVVDSYKYSAISGVTTDALNYRVGAGTEMKQVGTLKKGAKLNIVGIAYSKNTSNKWYKIKKGLKYYYVCSDWVDITSVDSSNGNENNLGNDSSNTGQPSFTNTGINTPSKIALGCKFSIIGTIDCNVPMERAKVGIVNSSKKWVTSKTVDLGEKTFDIASVDADIKFGQLTAGTYKYRVRVYVNGLWYDRVNSEFKVAKVKWPTHLGDTAVGLAWPEGTEASQIAYSTGGPTPEYQAALDLAYPNHSTESQSGKGASCDVFIGTVCVFSGYDTEMPSGLVAQQKYLAKSDKWQEVDYNFKESELKHGDILTYTNKNNNKHICMYVVINGKGRIAEASYTQHKYGFINTSLSKILKSSKVKKIRVYRATS